MADHARAIGDKCFKEEQFVAAVHCYEVATLLCPSGSPNKTKLPGPSAETFGHLGMVKNPRALKLKSLDFDL